jgi:hypothetical protein
MQARNRAVYLNFRKSLSGEIFPNVSCLSRVETAGLLKIMKNSYLFPLAALVLCASSSCDKPSSEVAQKIAALEQKNAAAAQRQLELEQQIEDQKLASERDGIERERVKIEEDRAELERQQGDAAAAQEAALRQREESLAKREGKLELFQSALEEKQDNLRSRDQKLSTRDREVAGREALPFEQTEQRQPVGDYGMFYESLSSYGSWFETPDYGYVWQPVVVRDTNWRPYSHGRWVCSDRGWTWVSEEPFGWATYHYGRWALLRGRGWIWVPGSEWAPSWVSWRENDNHIGWAPLPPETLAYRGQQWDSTVDVQFGIGAAWFNFVEVQNFANPVYRHCLPVSGNVTFLQQTTNITYIHIQKNQVICGGPQYQRVSDRVGRPFPFYRLEVDQHPRQSRDSLGMRPRIQGDRLMVSAPNMDAGWNDGLKPRRIKGRMESVSVERDGELNREIGDRYRQSREEGRQKAEQSITELGGHEKFEQSRNERLQENRRQANQGVRQLPKSDSRGAVPNPARPQPENIGNRGFVPAKPDGKKMPTPEVALRPSDEERKRSEVEADRIRPAATLPPRVVRGDDPKLPLGQSPKNERDGPRVAPKDDSAQEREQARQRQQQQLQEKQQLEKQREAEQAREAQKEVVNRRQQEQVQQRQQEQAQQRQQEQAQQRQQEKAQQRQQEQAQQRQQEQAQQRQQEQAQQRQQEQAQQRQQEQAQQRQQAENQRQREAKDKNDQDEQRKRNR